MKEREEARALRTDRGERLAVRRSPTRFRCAFFGPSQLHARRSGRCAGGGVAPIALASGAKLRACQVRTAVAQIAPGGAKCDFSPSDAKQWLRGCGAGVSFKDARARWCRAGPRRPAAGEARALHLPWHTATQPCVCSGRPTPRWNRHEASSKDSAAEARRATGVSLVFATDHGAAASACLDLAPAKRCLDLLHLPL